jgi:UDP-3-O-[3-hydroxymyristoyl] glucosamine N-acyltransferase
LPRCSAAPEQGYSAQELGELFAGAVIGQPERRGWRLAPLHRAGAGDIAFAATKRHLEALQESAAGIVLVCADLQAAAGLDSSRSSYVLVANPHAAFAHLSAHFGQRRRFVPGIEAGAWVDPEAVVDPAARICAGARIGAGSRIAAGVHVGAACVVGDRVHLGEDSYLSPGCLVLDEVRIGREVLLQPGVVLGADGFGFAAEAGEWVKIEHFGTVVIHDRVEIGANSTVDRGVLDDTVIHEGVKIDNLVHIAHNVIIGAHTAIAGCVGIAGSARIGRHCAIGGGAGILGHLEIVDHVTIHAMTLVTHSITRPGHYASGVPQQEADAWNHTLAAMRRLGRRGR